MYQVVITGPGCLTDVNYFMTPGTCQLTNTVIDCFQKKVQFSCSRGSTVVLEYSPGVVNATGWYTYPRSLVVTNYTATSPYSVNLQSGDRMSLYGIKPDNTPLIIIGSCMPSIFDTATPADVLPRPQALRLIPTSATTGGYVSLPSFTVGGNVTMEMWARIHAPPVNSARFFDFGNGVSADNVLAVPNTPGIYGTVYNQARWSGFGPTSAVPYDSTWFHVALTWQLDGGTSRGAPTATAKVYVNGTLVLTSKSLAPAPVPRSLNFLGKSNGATDPSIFMSIQEFRIWNVTRSDTDIASTYRRAIPYCDEPGLMIRYGLSQASGQPVDSCSATGLSATRQGTTTWEPSNRQYSVYGCFADPRGTDLVAVLAQGAMTPAWCAALASERGYPFFGLQNGTRCVAGPRFGAFGPGNCTTPCAGQSSAICGGPKANTVYSFADCRTPFTFVEGAYLTGFDIANVAVYSNIGSACTCSRMCQGFVACEFFSYQSTTRECRLQASYSDSTTMSMFRNAPAFTQGSVNGFDVSSAVTGSASDCRQLCLNTPACDMVSFYVPMSICYMKSLLRAPAAVFGYRSSSVSYSSLGCWLDDITRDLPIWLDTGSEPLTIDRCAVAAQRQNVQYFGLQNGTECWGGNSYGRYDQSTGCSAACAGDPSKVCGGPWANNVYLLSAAYSPRGCWADSPTRDFSNYLSLASAVTVDTCAAAAQKAGYLYFGVQDTNECWAGNSYGQFGTSTACSEACVGNPSQTCGGPWANSVFAFGTCPTSVPPNTAPPPVTFSYTRSFCGGITVALVATDSCPVGSNAVYDVQLVQLNINAAIQTARIVPAASELYPSVDFTNVVPNNYGITARVSCVTDCGLTLIASATVSLPLLTRLRPLVCCCQTCFCDTLGWGDPHISTVDGAFVSYYYPGDYILLEGPGVQVQGRMDVRLAWSQGQLSAYTGLAVRCGTDVLSVVQATNGTLFFTANGARWAIPPAPTPKSLNPPITTYGSIRIWTGYQNNYYSAWITIQCVAAGPANGLTVKANVATTAPAVMDITLSSPGSLVGQAKGLHGSLDNNPFNDLVWRNGTFLSLPPTTDINQIYAITSADGDVGSIQKSWAVYPGRDSLFTNNDIRDGTASNVYWTPPAKRRRSLLDDSVDLPKPTAPAPGSIERGVTACAPFFMAGSPYLQAAALDWAVMNGSVSCATLAGRSPAALMPQIGSTVVNLNDTSTSTRRSKGSGRTLVEVCATGDERVVIRGKFPDSIQTALIGSSTAEVLSANKRQVVLRTPPVLSGPTTGDADLLLETASGKRATLKHAVHVKRASISKLSATKVKRGAQLRITGSFGNFGVARVEVGGIRCRIVSASQTNILVIIPDNARLGQKNVAVYTKSCFGSAVLPKSIEVLRK